MPTYRPVLYVLAAACGACTLGGCPASNPPDPAQTINPTPEVEPNDEIDKATKVTLDAQGQARLVGTLGSIQEGDAADYYALPAVQAGDRITVDVNTPDSDLDAVVALFDADNKLFIVNDNEQGRSDLPDPLVDERFRHASDKCLLVMSRSAFSGVGASASGSYEIIVRVEGGGSVPAPTSQKLLLNFEGGTVTNRSGQTFTIGPFNAGEIDARYVGQTATVKQWILEMVKQNYARFKLEVFSTDNLVNRPTGNVSNVYFGGYETEGLGMAIDGTDPFNHDPTDSAIVFTGRFVPGLFTTAPDARQLGIAIGNVASHEAGHLFGLNHVRDAADLMNGYDAPNNLLVDQRFKRASMDLRILPLFSLFLEQDGGLLLAETLGRSAVAVASTVPVGGDPTVVAGADFDFDGRLDLAVANTVASEIYVLFGNGDRTFVQAGPFFAGDGPTDVAVADLDGDTDPDLAISNLVSDNVSVILNGTIITGTSGGDYAAGDGPQALAAADFDGDGDADLAVVNALSNDVAILLNNGDATFAAGQVIGGQALPLSVAAGDLDGDGDADLAVANGGASTGVGGIAILLNNGTGTFTPTATLGGDALPRHLILADLDGSGVLDVAVADLFSNGVVVLLNGGRASFASPAIYPVGDAPQWLTAADLDSDGDLDLVSANRDTPDISVLMNQGNGTFAPEWPYGLGQNASSVAAGDLDGDGDADLAVTAPDAGTVLILVNRGNGRFADPG